MIIHETPTCVAVSLYHLTHNNPVLYHVRPSDCNSSDKPDLYDSIAVNELWEGKYDPAMYFTRTDDMELVFFMGHSNVVQLMQFRGGCSLCAKNHALSCCPLARPFMNSSLQNGEDQIPKNVGDDELIEPKWRARKMREHEKKNKIINYVNNISISMANAQVDIFWNFSVYQ